MKLQYIFVLLFGFGLLQGCKSKKAIVSNPKSETEIFLSKSLNERPAFQRMSIRGKARINYPAKGLNMSANYQINIIGEDLIWIKISKLGLEGMRALISKDSVKVIDRMNQKFYQEDYGLVTDLTGLDANFAMVQDLLLGNLHLLRGMQNIEPVKEASEHRVFSGNEAGINFTYTIDPATFKLISMNAKDDKGNNSYLSYDDFRDMGATKLPYKGKVEMRSPDAASISFNHSRVEVNPEKILTRFNVPSHYERASQ